MKSLIFLVYCSIFVFVPIAAEAVDYTILDDASGGDCALFGDWNPTTKTCTLTSDVTGRIIINDYNITLDGNRKILTNPGNDAITVDLSRTGITIKNFIIQDIRIGVFANYNSQVTIIDNIIKRASFNAIYVRSTDSLIANNVVLDTADIGITSYGSIGGLGGNIISGNIVKRSSKGIGIIYTSNNTVENNLITDCTWINNMGLTLTGEISGNVFRNNTAMNCSIYVSSQPAGNYFYHNNFLGVSGWAENDNNYFNELLPDGGNYWSVYDTPAEGCDDLDFDGICDAPYSLTAPGFYTPYGTDYYPWNVMSGWNPDSDGDGYRAGPGIDCDDSDFYTNINAQEIISDGIDQDCNGLDLTIEITTLKYKASKDNLTVIATSALGAAADLVLDNYGPMTWTGSAWEMVVEPAGGNPGQVSITGIEGTVSAPTQ